MFETSERCWVLLLGVACEVCVCVFFRAPQKWDVCVEKRKPAQHAKTQINHEIKYMSEKRLVALHSL